MLLRPSRLAVAVARADHPLDGEMPWKVRDVTNYTTNYTGFESREAPPALHNVMVTCAAQLSSPGDAGDSTSSKSISENSSAIHTFSANETVTWSVSGGDDQSKFVINSSTGELIPNGTHGNSPLRF